MQHAARLRDACEIDGVHIFEDIVDDLRGETNQRICHILSCASLSLSLTLSPLSEQICCKNLMTEMRTSTILGKSVDLEMLLWSERLRTGNNDARCQNPRQL
jgi:hypothetical protein